MIAARSILAALALSVASLAPQAGLAEDEADSIVVTTNPAMVALQLRDMGYRAKLGKRGDRPTIDSGSSGYTFAITFYGCDGDIDCAGLLFDAVFDLDKGMSLERANHWNADRLFGRVFLDDTCDPVLDHYVLSDPIMSADVFERLIENWDHAMNNLTDFIGFNDDTPSTTVTNCGQKSDAI